MFSANDEPGGEGAIRLPDVLDSSYRKSAWPIMGNCLC